MSAEEPEEERHPLAGACVLVVFGGGVVAIAFAVDEAAGVLLLVAVGAFAVWRSARRVSDSSAPPPPPTGSDVYARETDIAREVRKGPGEGYTIFPEIEYVTDPSDLGEVTES